MLGSLAVWGAGSQLLVLQELLDCLDEKVSVIFSDYPEKAPIDAPIYSGNEAIAEWVRSNPEVREFAVAIGAHHGRVRLQKLELLSSLGMEATTLCHPTSTNLSNNIGRGCQLLARSFLGVRAKIGDGVILNSNCSVDHECILGDGVHIGPGAVLAGRVRVGAGTFVGAGATICPDLSICEDVIIGAGAVVVSDITEPGTYVGVPARRLHA